VTFAQVHALSLRRVSHALASWVPAGTRRLSLLFFRLSFAFMFFTLFPLLCLAWPFWSCVTHVPRLASSSFRPLFACLSLPFARSLQSTPCSPHLLPQAHGFGADPTYRCLNFIALCNILNLDCPWDRFSELAFFLLPRHYILATLAHKFLRS
jgi:hypothetical protein